MPLTRKCIDDRNPIKIIMEQEWTIGFEQIVIIKLSCPFGGLDEGSPRSARRSVILDRRGHWWMSFIWVRREDLRGTVGRSLVDAVWCGYENVAGTKAGAEKSSEAAESIEIAGSRGPVRGVENVDWSPQAESTGSGCLTRMIPGLPLMMCPSSSCWYFRNWTESDKLFLHFQSLPLKEL